MTSRRSVPDDGRLDAPLVIVGEAPSTQELARRKPFVGPSGGKLTEWWRRPDININRAKDCYLTNVFPYAITKVPRGGVHGINCTVEEWNEAVTNLHARLARLEVPHLIVAVGDLALQALRGHGGILKWRGSILVYAPSQTRLIATVHPAALFRDPSLERRCIADWQKIARELRTPSTLPKRRHHIAPSFAEVQAFVREVDAAGKAGILAIDIETPVKMKTVKALTPKGRPTTKKVRGKPFIGCVGFALSPTESITIPTQRAYWKQYGVDLADVWEAIRQLCASPTQKVLQNGFFDTFYLLREQGITLRNWRWDTLAMHHVIDASEEHSLAYLASIYTNEPYWKDEGKTAGDLRGMPNDLEQWWRYNGKDACVTRELVDALRGELDKLPNGQQFYRDHYRKCFQPILGMMDDGICVDEERRLARHAALTAKAERLKAKINTAAGTNLLGKTSLSSTKLRTFLYDTLKLPKQLAKNARKEKVVSAGEIQLRKLMLKYPTHEQLGKVGRLVLKYRRTHKLSTFFQDKLVDKDGRVRCTYTFETDTGRLSSRQNPMGGGMNLQNVDREARDVFIADPGGIFIEGDLSQAESRIVYTLTGDPELIEVAQRMPWEYDSHTENTARILGIAMEDVTKEDRRNIGKPTAHASHYGQMGPTMSDTMLKHGVVMTPEECQGHINAYLTWRHQIPKWHQSIKWTVIDQRRLVNSWGRVADFRYMRLVPHLYQKAFNFLPQSEVAGIINQYGMIPIHKAIRTEGKPHRLRLQTHDSLTYWSPLNVDDVWWIIQTMRHFLERPRPYNGTELTIPVEFKIGTNWGQMIEFKKPPTKRDVRAALDQLQ